MNLALLVRRSQKRRQKLLELLTIPGKIQRSFPFLPFTVRKQIISLFIIFIRRPSHWQATLNTDCIENPFRTINGKSEAIKSVNEFGVNISLIVLLLGQMKRLLLFKVCKIIQYRGSPPTVAMSNRPSG